VMKLALTIITIALIAGLTLGAVLIAYSLNSVAVRNRYVGIMISIKPDPRDLEFYIYLGTKILSPYEEQLYIEQRTGFLEDILRQDLNAVFKAMVSFHHLLTEQEVDQLLRKYELNILEARVLNLNVSPPSSGGWKVYNNSLVQSRKYYAECYKYVTERHYKDQKEAYLTGYRVEGVIVEGQIQELYRLSKNPMVKLVDLIYVTDEIINDVLKQLNVSKHGFPEDINYYRQQGYEVEVFIKPVTMPPFEISKYYSSP